MRIAYQIEDIEKECFEYGRKLHPLSLLKREAVKTVQKTTLSSWMELEWIRRNIDMGTEVGGREHVEI